MRQEIQEALVSRVLTHLAEGTTDTGPAIGKVATTSYASRDRLDRELSQIFRRSALMICHVSRLRAPGDFVTVEVAGVPVLAVRNDHGGVSAFMNVCRHRGTQVVAEECGHKNSFACPYHGWTYDRDGCLIGAPHASGFEEHTPWPPKLVQLPTAVRAGFVFVRLTPTGAPELEPGSFEMIARDLEGWFIRDHVAYAPRSITKQLNWKLVIDIFLEAYHLKTTHRNTIYQLFFDNLGLVDPFGPHTRNVFPKRSIKGLENRPRSEWRIRDHANVLYHLFPNTLILMEPDHAAVLHCYPLEVDRTRIDAYTLIPAPAETEKARAYWDKNNAILYGAIEEDFAMGESIQRGIRSGANESLTFGRFEHALTHFHRNVEEALESA
jgi:phenylpropionate dioxygenase-like ring-hydroxylating dioxygenase large terminal subunit